MFEARIDRMISELLGNPIDTSLVDWSGRLPKWITEGLLAEFVQYRERERERERASMDQLCIERYHV